MLKYKYVFQVKYTEAISSNSTRKLLWFEIIKSANLSKVSRSRRAQFFAWNSGAPAFGGLLDFADPAQLIATSLSQHHEQAEIQWVDWWSAAPTDVIIK